MNLYFSPATVPEIAGLPASEQKALFNRLPRIGLKHLGGFPGLVRKYPLVVVGFVGIVLIYLIIILSSLPLFLQSMLSLFSFLGFALPTRSCLITEGREALRLQGYPRA